MKKRILSLLLTAVLMLSILPAAGAVQGEAARAADTLAALQLVAEDTGSLDDSVNRAQAAIWLVKLAGAEAAAKKSTSKSAFTDLPAASAKYIHYAALQGWVSGYSSGTFGTERAVSANAWFTMLLRMLSYEKGMDFVSSDAAAFARRIGLAQRDYSGTMTRGDLYESMLDSLTFCYKDTDVTVLDRLMEKGVCPRYTARALGLLEETLTAREAADRHMASVVCLDVFKTQEDIDDNAPSANATAFFISKDGLAVTNYHSIQNGLKAVATLASGDQYEVEGIVYYDVAIDIAVIRVSNKELNGRNTTTFAPLEVVGTGDIRPGDTVYAIGNPLGLGLCVSSGIIAATAREVERYQLPCVVNSADISQGSSGGALLNEYGQVIAVTSGAYTYGNNMFLAVPADPILSADLGAEAEPLAEVTARESAAADAAN